VDAMGTRKIPLTGVSPAWLGFLAFQLVKLFTDPGHVILLALGVAIVVGIYLVGRRRRNAGHHLDQLDDDRQHPPGHGHQHGAGHDHKHGPDHGPADPERHHP
jgi:hypothetical protein